MAREAAAGRINAQVASLRSAALDSGVVDDEALDAVVDQLARIPDAVDEMPSPDQDSYPWEAPIDDDAALVLAAAPAIVVHLASQLAFRSGSDEPAAAGWDPGLAAAVAGAETEHLELLAEAWEAAETSDVELMRALYAHVLGSLVDLVELCAAVGALDADARRVAHLGLRTCAVARRRAMIAAALVQLLRRASTPRGAAGLRRITSGRGVATRHEPDLWTASTSIDGVDEGDSTRFVGLVTETGWVDRPEIPYSFARTTGDVEVRVHHRDVQRSGLQTGSLLWVHGKVEDLDGAPGIVAHFEGPGSHAGEVWEDFLADDVREAYDLYPNVVEAVWEFPVCTARNGAADLLGRI